MSNPNNPLERHLANAFADFEGLRLSGSIPLREEVLNEIIAEVLRNGVPQPPAAPAAPAEADPFAPAPSPLVSAAPEAAASAAARPKVDVNALLGRVKSARVRFEAGRAVLDFDIGV